jgi:hypothetical protein
LFISGDVFKVPGPSKDLIGLSFLISLRWQICAGFDDFSGILSVSDVGFH